MISFRRVCSQDLIASRIRNLSVFCTKMSLSKDNQQELLVNSCNQKKRQVGLESSEFQHGMFLFINNSITRVNKIVSD